jgi:lactam utilization protein B
VRVHSDTPDAAAMLLVLRQRLKEEGIGVKAFSE